MTRAAFNTTAAIYTGFGADPPFEYQFSIECRLVPNRFTLAMLPPPLDYTHYVNWQSPALDSGETFFDGLIVNWDFSIATVWEIPEGGGVYYLTLFTAVIDPPDPVNAPYRRAWLLQL